MVTRATKLRQSIEANSNSDDQSVMDLEEVEDEVIKDDDKFKILLSVIQIPIGNSSFGMQTFHLKHGR